MSAVAVELFSADPYRVVPERAPGRSEGQMRRDRQALRIANGLHPLSIHGMKIPLHPAAPRDATKEDRRDYPRCRSCVFRELTEGGNRRYPKCRAGAPTVLDSPRYSAGEDTDCRAWWPACVNFQMVTRRDKP